MPVTPIEACEGKFCSHCGGPATHAYGSCWLCCDCHAAPGEGPRPKTLDQWGELVDRLNTRLEALAAERDALIEAGAHLIGMTAGMNGFATTFGENRASFLAAAGVQDETEEGR